MCWGGTHKTLVPTLLLVRNSRPPHPTKRSQRLFFTAVLKPCGWVWMPFPSVVWTVLWLRCTYPLKPWQIVSSLKAPRYLEVFEWSLISLGIMQTPASLLGIFVLPRTSWGQGRYGSLVTHRKKVLPCHWNLYLLFVLSHVLTARESTRLPVFEPAECSVLCSKISLAVSAFRVSGSTFTSTFYFWMRLWSFWLTAS